MIRILILEDDDERIKQFKKHFLNCDITFVKESKVCINILKESDPFDFIFLDHDLGGKIYVESGEDTGYEVAKWLSKNADKKPVAGMYTHSFNYPGANNIIGVISKVKECRHVPGIWNKKIDFNILFIG